MNKFSKVSLAVLGALAIVGPASAQESWFQRDRYTAVADRQQPEFNPEPVRVGTIITNPELLVGVEHNDNVFAAPDDSAFIESDTVFRIAPRVRAVTDWTRHQVNLYAIADHREYADFGDESHTNLSAGLGGRLDVTRELSLNASVNAFDGSESRRAITGNPLLELFEYQSLGFVAGADWERERTRASLDVATTEFEYEDSRIREGITGAGTPVALGDIRDRTENRVTGRLGYAVTRNLSVFGTAGVYNREYDVDTSRDAEGYNVAAGTNFELVRALLRGEIAVGYFEEELDDGGDALDGVSLDGRLSWFVTELTTVTVNGARRAVDPGLPDVRNAISTSYGVAC